MATKNVISGKRRDQEEEERTLNYAAEEQSDEETDSDSESAEEAAPPLVPPKKPKFITPLKPLGPETVENGSACSSPSASGFIIMPSQKPSGDKKRKAPASKVFGRDDVIALLKGLAVFWVTGKNNKWAEFHHFIKGDLRNQFTKIQVSEKIRALKKKFYANWERANGGHLDLSDPHELAVFELSKELWGDETGIAPEKGQMVENEDEEADDITRERNLVSENDEGSKNVKKRKQASEIDEGSKSTKKRKQLGEHGEVNKKIRKQEHGIKELLEEGDEHDAANTILSIRNMVDEHGGGNKKTRKGEQVDELDDKKELLKEGIQVDDYDKATKIPSKQKRVDEFGEGKRKKKKRKQLDERDEANKTASEQKEVDEHVEKKESLKEVNQHDENEELMNEGKRADEYEEQDVTTGKQKQVDGHELKKDLAKQGKQLDDHHEEDNIPANQKQEMKISAEDFQSAYPLLCASFDIFGYPMVAKKNCFMIGRENAQELEEKWREFNAEAHHLELKRLDLMKRDFQGRLQRK
ncbi:hypothetical protein C2S53_001975 [Perilla frutescens var. hirtella]|uniref:Glabrous enhancer-binding protein-like DBD domain-containing protein n=1 Tax=Perilla frutescens var. hirtella TaxID=608512 RepID=A0AAD4JPY3_PERFH|nr:hypothetical protein C2S53_001975 [Perilla frutescens var. hirtella]